jgi:hypothetical protein
MISLTNPLTVMALAATILSPPITHGQDSNTNTFPFTTNLPLHGNGDVQVVNIECYSDIVEIATNDYVLLQILYEPRSGYYYWIGDRFPQKDIPFNSVIERQKQFMDFWLIPNVGIVDGRCRQGLDIYSQKIPNIELAQIKIVDELKASNKNFPWPGMTVTKKIDLPLSVKTLGFDFFYVRMVAKPPPEPKTLSLSYSNSIWTIKIESATAMTNRMAVFELDSNFKVLKAIRSN